MCSPLRGGNGDTEWGFAQSLSHQMQVGKLGLRLSRQMQRCMYFVLFCFLIYNVVLVFAVQQKCISYTYTYIHS